MKGGAGQHFTPRPLIQAIVDVMQPRIAAEIVEDLRATLEQFEAVPADLPARGAEPAA